MDAKKDETISKMRRPGDDDSDEESPMDLFPPLLLGPPDENLGSNEETATRKRKSCDNAFVDKNLGITLSADIGDLNGVGAPLKGFKSLRRQPMKRNEAQETVMSRSKSYAVADADEKHLELSLSDDQSILDAVGASLEEFLQFPQTLLPSENSAPTQETTASIPSAPHAINGHASTPSPAVSSAPLAVHSASSGRPKPAPKGSTKGDKLDHPPFPWATDRRATVHSLRHLLSQGITTISGQVECTVCTKRTNISYDLESKFAEVARFIAERQEYMYDRAPEEWMNPVQLDCTLCEKKETLLPVISSKKRAINWLFLFLWQGIGFCNLTHLKYFCKHTKNLRTGVKDRLVYIAYMTLYDQLSRC